MPPSPKPDASFHKEDSPSTQSLMSSPRASFSFRRHRRLPFLLSFPLSLLLIYFLAPAFIPPSTIFIPIAPYVPHADKSALKSTIVLPRIQYTFPSGLGADLERRAQVKAAIERTWELYVREAWGWDEVRPVQGGGKDTRNGWGATIVDGLDTLIIAGLYDQLYRALNYTVSIDFSNPDGLVDPFETIIRYVGGLVATVDLLEYGFAGDNFDKNGLRAIRKQAEVLVRKLAPGLDSPSRMWLPRVDFRTGRGIREDLWGSTVVSPARGGSNILEYGRLTEQAVEIEYFRNATAAWWPLVKPVRESIIPGIIASPLSVDDGESVGHDLSWGGGQDSFYEYLIKTFVLWPNQKTRLYRDRWLLAVENTMKNLSSWSAPIGKHPSYRYLAIHDRKKKNEMGHLTCFAPGNFMLGGRALSRPDIFQFGLDVLEGCWHAYNVTATGVGPERTTPSQKFLRQVWQWKSNDTDDQPYTQISRQELEKYGIWSIERGYYLRPETIESLFYAYRLTGNKVYQDRAWIAFEHISALTRAQHGYSSVKNVMTPGGWYQSDDQESYWLAETLKYLYLIFDDPSRISLDEWVFNTEAHPLRRGRTVHW